MRTPGISRSVLRRRKGQSSRSVCRKGGPRGTRNVGYCPIFSNSHGGCPRRSSGRLCQPQARSRVPRLPAGPDHAAVRLGRVSRNLANPYMCKFPPECLTDLLIRGAAQLRELSSFHPGSRNESPVERYTTAETDSGRRVRSLLTRRVDEPGPDAEPDPTLVTINTLVATIPEGGGAPDFGPYQRAP